MFLFLTLFIHNIIIFYSKNSNNNEKLLFVWEHFRHGARGPYRSFDEKNWKDLLNEKWDGEGELSPLGMRMHYLLGVSTKEKYKNFLSEKYNPNEILIRSTDVNRTIVSAFSTLQGIYNSSTVDELTEKQIKKGNIQNCNKSELINKKIQDLGNKMIDKGNNLYPVHIYPTNYDHQFQIYRTEECPGIAKYIEEARDTDELRQIFNETSTKINNTYGEYIFKFMNKSGIEEPYYLFDYSELFSIADTFIADYYNGRELKDVNETGINMEDFYNDCLNISFIESYYRQFGTPVSKVLYIGVSPVFRTLFNYMDMRINLDKNGEPDKILSLSPRFVITAGHDSSLAANDLFLKAEFNISFERAEYSHSQYYELWKNENNGKYFIKYLVNHELKAIFDYYEFKEKVLPKLYSPEEIDKICNEINEPILLLENKIKRKKSNFQLLFLIFPLIVILCFIYLSYEVFYNNRNKFKKL